MGQDSAVDLATRYGLEGPGIEIPLGAIYSATVQTVPQCHSAFYK